MHSFSKEMMQGKSVTYWAFIVPYTVQLYVIWFHAEVRCCRAEVKWESQSYYRSFFCWSCCSVLHFISQLLILGQKHWKYHVGTQFFEKRFVLKWKSTWKLPADWYKIIFRNMTYIVYLQTHTHHHHHDDSICCHQMSPIPQCRSLQPPEFFSQTMLNISSYSCVFINGYKLTSLWITNWKNSLWYLCTRKHSVCSVFS